MYKNIHTGMNRASGGARGGFLKLKYQSELNIFKCYLLFREKTPAGQA